MGDEDPLDVLQTELTEKAEDKKEAEEEKEEQKEGKKEQKGEKEEEIDDREGEDYLLDDVHIGRGAGRKHGYEASKETTPQMRKGIRCKIAPHDNLCGPRVMQDMDQSSTPRGVFVRNIFATPCQRSAY